MIVKAFLRFDESRKFISRNFFHRRFGKVQIIPKISPNFDLAKVSFTKVSPNKVYMYDFLIPFTLFLSFSTGGSQTNNHLIKLVRSVLE